jgi:hypothetical protein
VRLRALAACGLFASLLARGALADPHSLTGAYSPYEQQAIDEAEIGLGSRVDPSPEGKLIESIEFVRLEPIDPHDPLPAAIDVVHTTSRPWVLRRELVAREGQTWSTVVVDESARNLRKLPQLSLVVCVPMVGSAPDRVRLVVITKDVWSLYVDFDLAVTSGGLESLTLEPKESNVAGLQHTALGRFVLQPETLTLGASYHVPRLDGRWIDVLVDGNVVLNRANGEPEGMFGTATAGRPLVTSRTEWAWSTGTTFSNQLVRRYVNASVATFTPSAPGATPIPWVYRERTFAQDAKLTRSFGWETKNDVSVGAYFSHTRYVVPPDASFDPESVREFVSVATPTGEDRVGPFAQWHGYSNDYLRTFDLDTLGLQEDHRLGHDLWLRVYPVLRAVGSSRDLFGTYGGAAYAVPLGDGLARATLESTLETTAEGLSDASFKTALGVVTPRLGLGRIVLKATFLDRFENYLNVRTFIGGESLLRGYPSRYLSGKDYAAANLEYRTRSIELAAIHFGAALFYDVADAFDHVGDLDPKHSVGGGLRVVFPQIDRTVLRFDVGVPVSSAPLPSDVPPVSFFLAFQQAFLLPSVGGGFAP